MEKTEIVIVPGPGFGHLLSCTEFGNRLIQLNNHLTVTFLLLRAPFAPDLDVYTQSLKSTDSRIQFLCLPIVDPPPISPPFLLLEKFITNYIESHKHHVKEAIINHVLSKNDSRLACLVLDFGCTSMIDVATELGVPSYVFFTSSAASLGFMMHLSKIKEQDLQEQDHFNIPSYVNPVPRSVLPNFMFSEAREYMCNHGRRFLETKGLIVNTFAELEPHAIRSLVGGDDSHVPPVYTLGPILDFKGVQGQSSEKIMKWLDDKPPRSVVFLCFGSSGRFGAAQLKEIALGLEKSGHRFLWSIRKPAKAGEFMPGDLENLEDVLPDGFLERTKEQGMICGKAPQIQVLAHKATGAFVSHCGWNSILESLWHGVPIVTWPLYAEQQINAFQMVKDLGLAVELRLDYRMGAGSDVVMADEIERAVNCVMDGGNEVRKRVQEMGKRARDAVVEGGSSFDSLQRLIQVMLGN